MTEELNDLINRIEILEKENLELKTEKDKKEREKTAFQMVFFLYLIPLVVAIFATLSFKYPTDWREYIISSIYMILILYLLLDSEFGKSLFKYTLVYYFVFQHEEGERKHFIIYFIYVFSLPALLIVFERYLNQFDEIFNLILLLFSFLLLYTIDVIISFILRISNFIIPRRFFITLENFWEVRKDKTKIMIRIIPITVVAAVLVSVVLWFI